MTFAEKKDRLERCGLCGESCTTQQDVIQYHGGIGGLVHADCLQEHAEAALDTEREEIRRLA